MYVERHRVSLATGAGETSDTDYTPAVTGRILSIIYTKPGSDGFTTATVAVTTETTTQTLWSEASINASTVRNPRQGAHGSDGGALYYNDESDEPVAEPFVVADERIKIAVSSVLASESGTFDILVG